MSSVHRDLAAALLAVDRNHRPVNVGLAAQLACLLEVSAPKPGNVSPGRHFADLRYEDFLASALAIGEPMAAAGEHSVGVTVRRAVEATARWSRSNTNLGIVLLFAPLARAALRCRGQTPLMPDDSRGLTLQDRVREGARGDNGRRCQASVCGDPSRQTRRAGSRGRTGCVDRADDDAGRGHATGSAQGHHRIRVCDWVRSNVRDWRCLRSSERVMTACPWDDAVVETFLTILAAVLIRTSRGGAVRRGRPTVSTRARAGACGGRRPVGRRAAGARRHGPCAARREKQRQPGDDS